MKTRTTAILLVLLLVGSTSDIVIEVTGAQSTGYLAIKDYLGRTWTIDDVNKIINTIIQTTAGELKSLADYFWIVIDNDIDNPINLRNFTVSPLDNKTAVIALSPGDHIIDIYWFGYHQRQLVHIVENQHYILNLDTAPVMPFQTVGEPPSLAEWDLTSSPDGLVIQRRDGNAFVKFVYNQTYIQVAWYDEDTGWNYYPLDIDINNNYDWRFHITDPGNPEYTEEHTGSFLWFTWDVAKVLETVKWNRTGEILHVSYIVIVAENQLLYNAVAEFWSGLGLSAVGLGIKYGYVDIVTGTIMELQGFATLMQSAYDTYMGEFFAGKYQKTITIVWDIFCTPTQIVILAHAYDVDSTGKLTPRPITSQNAFTIGNRLVFWKLLSGGYYYSYRNINGYSYTPGNYLYLKTSYKYYTLDNTIFIPGGKYYVIQLDDLSKYRYGVWVKTHFLMQTPSTAARKMLLKAYIKLTFNNVSKADQFENNLLEQGIPYTRSGNTFTFEKRELVEGVAEKTLFIIFDSKEFEWLVPTGSEGYVTLDVYGQIYSGEASTLKKINDIYVLYYVIPKMAPPRINLLKDGFQVVNGAFAVQVYTDLYRGDKDAYLLGYYLLGNTPPPSYIIRDVYYDVDNDVIHYVYTIISADCYGQDIIDVTWSYNSTTNVTSYRLTIKPTVRLFNNVVLALFNFNKMSFLNLAPEVIEYLLAIPPSQGGYGTPIIDWSKMSTITLNFSRPYELYYYDKPSGSWVKVKTVCHNDTKVYDIVRYADNALVEKLNVSKMSEYYYKLVYTDTNETHKGWLFNDNGTLKMITGEVRWSLTPEELQQLLQQVQIQAMYEQWLQQWQQAAEQLGLVAGAIQEALDKVTGAWSWLSANWKWLLLGVGAFITFILLAGSRGTRIIMAPTR